MTEQEPSIVIDHPHPFFNGLAKKHTTIKHLDGSTFEMAYTLTLPPAGVTPTGQRILLIQGFLAPGAPWRAAATDLAALGHEALFFDHAGIGHSTYPTSKPWRMTTRRYAAHVRQLLDNVWGNGTEGSGGHFHIAAISMGGMIAQELAHSILKRDPERLRSLTLISTHPGGWKNKIPPLSGVGTVVNSLIYRNDKVKRAEAVMVPTLVHSKHQNVVHPCGTLGAEKARDYFVAAWESHPDTPFRVFMSQALAVFTHNVPEDRLVFIREKMNGRPIFVTTGDVDAMVRPSNSYYLSKVLKARFHLMSECGHAVFIQEKDFCVNQIHRQATEGAVAPVEDEFSVPASPGTMNAKSAAAADARDVELDIDADATSSALPSSERTPLLLHRTL